LELEDLDEKELIRLYWKEKLSLREIAEIYNCNKETIRERMERYNIPRRNTSEANKFLSMRQEEELRQKLIEDLKSFKPIKYKFKNRDNIFVPLPIKAFKKNKAGEGRLTLVLSDLHIGDTDHLPSSYWSTISNLLEILKVLKERFVIPHINIVLNGDIVCGRQVFRFQEFRTLVPRGHWQVFLAEMILKDTIKEIEKVLKVKDIYFLKGTHEEHAENYVLYLKRTFPNTKYAGHKLILNIGEDIGKCNIMFTHGYGSSEYYPISYSLIRDLWKTISEHKKRDVPIERVCIGHYHWLNVEQNFESFILDCTGGFQRWELTLSQRPVGAILYFFYEDTITAIPVRPDKKILDEELSDPGLEYKNMKYYSQMLLKHLKEIEGIIDEA